MDEYVMNFEVAKPKRTDEEKREQTRQRVAAFRERKRKESSPSTKQAHKWQSNFDALTEPERAALLAQAERYKVLQDRIFADDWSVYRELKEFIAQTGGTVRHWVPVLSAPDVDLEKECASDSNFIRFGYRTRVWSEFHRQFLKRLVANESVDPQIRQEAQSELKPMLAYLDERPALPTPTPPVGLPQRTKNEEAANERWKADRQIQQALFDKSYRQHLLDKFDAELDDVLGENP